MLGQDLRRMCFSMPAKTTIAPMEVWRLGIIPPYHGYPPKLYFGCLDLYSGFMNGPCGLGSGEWGPGSDVRDCPMIDAKFFKPKAKGKIAQDVANGANQIGDFCYHVPVPGKMFRPL